MQLPSNQPIKGIIFNDLPLLFSHVASLVNESQREWELG